MEFDFTQADTHVAKLKELVDKTDFPDSINAKAKAFKKLVQTFYVLYNNQVAGDDVKLRHLVTLYSLARLHKELIKPLRESQQSSGERILAYARHKDDEKYYQTLKDIIDALKPVLQQYCDTDDAKQAMIIEGEGEARFYKAGPVLDESLNSNISSLSQLERKLYVLTYFEVLEEDATSTVSRVNKASAAGILAATAVAGPMGLAGGLVIHMYAGTKAKATAATAQRSLSRNAFNGFTDQWKESLTAFLASEETARGAAQMTVMSTPDRRARNTLSI